MRGSFIFSAIYAFNFKVIWFQMKRYFIFSAIYDPLTFVLILMLQFQSWDVEWKV